MKSTLLTCMAALLLSFAAGCADAPTSVPPLTTQPAIDVLFSPHGGCTARIVDEIGKAKKTLRVQAYSFTSAPIAKAVVDAQKRGVDCEVLLDKSQAKQTYSEVDFFHNQGVPTFIDDRHAIAHNKIILIDDATVITGSFNFTKAAEESNAENLLVIKGDADLAAKYARNYAEHRAHSRKYEGRKETDDKPRKAPRSAPRKGASRWWNKDDPSATTVVDGVGHQNWIVISLATVVVDR